VGKLIQVAWEKGGGIANLQAYGYGSFTICKKCDQLCLDKCEIGIGGQGNFGGNWRVARIQFQRRSRGVGIYAVVPQRSVGRVLSMEGSI